MGHDILINMERNIYNKMFAFQLFVLFTIVHIMYQNIKILEFENFFCNFYVIICENVKINESNFLLIPKTDSNTFKIESFAFFEKEKITKKNCNFLSHFNYPKQTVSETEC